MAQISPPSGRLSYKELERLVSEGVIHTVHICIVDYCGRLSGSHRFVAKNFIAAGENSPFSITGSNLCFGLDGNPVYNSFLNLESGTRNKIAITDSDSISLSWFEGEAFAIYDFYDPITKSPVVCCPRVLLKKFISDYSSENLVIKAASEMEFYLLERVSSENKYDISIRDCKMLWTNTSYCDSRLSNRIEPVLRDIRETCVKAGINVEASQVEYGPGQIEFQICYEEVLKMCDSQIKFREIVRSVAYNHKLHATFMSKIWKDFPGNGCHFHISLWDKISDKNVFDGNDFEVHPGVKASNYLLYFIGGLTKYTKEIFPMLAQYVNSYKRFKPMAFAPINFDVWGYDNRYATFRVVGTGPSLRVEVRIAGGDVNPYLGYSGVLACGLRGIKEKLLPPEIR